VPVSRAGPEQLALATARTALGVRDRAMEVSDERVSGILIIVRICDISSAQHSPGFRLGFPERSAARKLEVIRAFPLVNYLPVAPRARA
jgi:hypothetical protein